jgi:galactokinase
MNESLDHLVDRAADLFRRRYGRAPRWIVAAPGRVNIIGEHVDYNDGFVLPMAIERYTVIAAADGGTQDDAVIYSAATNEEAVVSLTQPPRRPHGHWSNYVAGVIAGCLARNMRPAAFQAVIESSVPYGGGLSSSASLEMALVTLMEAMSDVQVSPEEKARIGLEAEHQYAGVPCGIMDQSASAMCRPDHLMLLDCRSQKVEQIPLVDPGITVLIINTNVKHELTGGEYAERRQKCESAARKLHVASLRDATMEQLEAKRDVLENVEYRRARHAIGEIARTLDAVAAIKTKDWPTVGRLMYASHDSLRDDYEVSCPELDQLVDAARELGAAGGVIGSRMTGGGFGGCTVTLAETSRVDAISKRLADGYQKKFGIEPTVLTSRPARGAHVVQAV